MDPVLHEEQSEGNKIKKTPNTEWSLKGLLEARCQMTQV